MYKKLWVKIRMYFFKEYKRMCDSRKMCTQENKCVCQGKKVSNLSKFLTIIVYLKNIACKYCL